MTTRPSPPSHSTPHCFTGYSVLVVDDDAVLRGLIRHLLEDEGYTVLEAQDGQAALDILRQRTEPRIVLTNYHMPRLDGPGLIRAVLQDPGLVGRHAFICMTGHPDGLSPAYRQQLQELCAPIVRKPFDANELLTVVAAAVERLGNGNAERSASSEPDGEPVPS